MIYIYIFSLPNFFCTIIFTYINLCININACIYPCVCKYMCVCAYIYILTMIYNTM